MSFGHLLSLRRVRPADGLMALVVALVVAGCTVATTPGDGWTYAPVAPSPLAAASAGPSASAPPAPSASPPTSAVPSASASRSPGPSSSPGPTAGLYTFVKQQACPESRFQCITLAVPKDHFAAAGPTWDVTFAIQKAAKARKGTFVVITGGPGSSGISAADGYTDYYDSAITDAYDIVFVDQRGIGLSGPIQCIKAAATYYADPNRVQVPAERPAAEAAAQAFVTDCIAESGVVPADLPLYSTKQAIEDLEAIRAYLGVDKLHLYGESYGTQFVQTYAAAHPDHIATLYADGPVDLTIDGITYYVESTRSAEDTLVSVLAACSTTSSCRKDVNGGDALAAYDALRTRLATAPIPYQYTTGEGKTESRSLTSTDLENAAFGELYSPGDREPLQRAIASASHGNLIPLAKLAYDSIGVDPDTQQAEEDPTWSDALYYAVECQDYAFYPTAGDPSARLTAWLDAGRQEGIDALRLGTSFYGDVPCLFWPTAAATDTRPAPLVDTPFPVFVLTSTTDPATPIVNGYRIYSRLDDAWFFQTLGGPHVIYGWGESCPDDVIRDYLVHGTLPTVRVTTCDGDVATEYVRIAALTKGGYHDALDFMSSMDDQLLNTDDYLARLDADPLPSGCDFGGAVTYRPTDSGTKLELDGCAFIKGVPLTGKGEVKDDDGSFTLKVTTGGDELTYARDGDGSREVKGTYRGRAVDLKAAA